MSTWWYVVAIVGLAAVGVVYLRARGTSNSGRSTADRQAGVSAHPDYRQDREDSRLAQMSQEDRAWQTASLERNRESQERAHNPTERPAPLG